MDWQRCPKQGEDTARHRPALAERIVANVTWTANVPVNERLRVVLFGSEGGERYADTTGPSPISIDVGFGAASPGHVTLAVQADTVPAGASDQAVEANLVLVGVAHVSGEPGTSSCAVGG